MLCSKCKNPIESGSSVCGWCGAKFVDLTENESQEHGLDTELVKIISRVPMPPRITKFKHPAIILYQKTTGKNKYEGYYYVARLDFFRLYKFADESAWKIEWNRKKKKARNKSWAFLFLPIPIIFSFISITRWSKIRQYKKFGL